MYQLALQKVLVLSRALARSQHMRKIHSSANRGKNQELFHDHNNAKPNVWHYFTKAEVYSLFLQPLGIILVYLAAVWQLFKYYCKIKDVSLQDALHIQVDHFVDTLRWIQSRVKSRD